MSSNHNWVCFECRFSKREPKTSNLIPKCNSCKGDLYCLGYKVAIPKKTDLKNWKKLKEDCFKRSITALEREAINQIKEKHSSEKEEIKPKFIFKN